MSDDPLHLGGLNPEVVEAAVEGRKKKGKESQMLNAETAAKKEERLAKKVADPGPSAPPPPSVSEPTVEDKSKLLDKLQAYRERFPHLKSRNKVSARSSYDEIADELHYVEQQLGAREPLGPQLFFMAMSGVEELSHVYNPMGLNLTGLGAVARENEAQFAPILDELIIKYALNMSLGPEMRLAMATATLIYTVHAANSGNPTVAKAMEAMARPVPTKVKKEGL